ncbi:ClpXP protease specificity-enhancing factor SspB [Xanthobacteraceae bacterium Astr-EGSB]|uniref:SspB family protein n=1 Tax=Astrobacterium formosum TaxID=3069710 RepID=UPI0027B7765B|nr:ClpXP protease specificity-enhancing factor SspB [Xanthobacteraceae bacterium Astr-EGSB]
MAVDHIRYDILTQEALRGVVRTVLADAAAHGLPGEHHFFVSFDTNAEGVRMSPRLKAMYPAEMTVVLQHQFWDLVVGEENFEVGLSFNGIPERVSVPFAAVKGFFDPSVQFALQFAPGVVEGVVGDDQAVSAEASPAPPPAEPKGNDEPPKPDDGAAVVSLDRFRKKK